MRTFREITLKEAEELNELDVVNKVMAKIKDISKKTKKEGTDTKEMFKVFANSLKAKLKGNENPSPEELKNAISQLKDIGKISVLVPVFLLPGSVITIPILDKIAK